MVHYDKHNIIIIILYNNDNNSIAITAPMVNSHSVIEVLWPKYHDLVKTRLDVALSCKNLVK